ncbi:MAG: C4-type zinc ribbon domain-containing protein [Actinomycetes bacterium]|jgi:predicted  nucleic acid-binding Zn-ribbon protein|nr:C4-type zinc ribbon domain-containing protein [Actinomycetes bacterium]
MPEPVGAYSPEAQKLFSAQELDLKVDELERKRQDQAPRVQLAQLHKQYVANKQKLAEVRSAIDASQAQSDTMSSDLEALDAQIAREQKKLQASKAHREVEALSRELDGLAAQKNEREERAMQVMENRQGLRTMAAALEKKVAELASAVQQGSAAVKDRNERIVAKQTELAEQSAALLETLDPGLVQAYRALKGASLGAVAVAHYQQRRCGACSVMLPQSLIPAIEAAEALYRCPSCHRILIPAPDEDDAGDGGDAAAEGE